ncbi:hypothetical protein GALMADRAFT_47350, partial [Galerina marginata CBS 339.88]
MLLWIICSLTPQEVREKIQCGDSDFIKSLIDYLESTSKGEFLTGTMSTIEGNVNLAKVEPGYIDPTQTLASKPPPLCKNCSKVGCSRCTKQDEWWKSVFATETDDLLLKSNVHTCSSGFKKNGEIMKNKDYVGCLNNKWKKCKARFPRTILKETKVDIESGRIDLKKLEPFINTYNPLLTFVLRCNTDVTCLHSGTAVKAVVAYVSDYISKYGLKTHVIFDTIRNIYNR